MALRVGVVGCGGMGSWHAMNVSRQPDVEIVAVADAVADAAQRLANDVDARVASGTEVATADDIDAVVIASSDDTHAEFAVAAIEAGKPTLCEKPLGATVEQARQVLDAEVAAGRPLVRLGFMRPVDPAHVALANVVAGLGTLTRVRCVHRNVDPAKRPVEALFAQSMSHDIHTIRWLTGAEFTAVTAYVAARPDGFNDVLMVGQLDSGALGTIDFEDQAYAYEVHVEVTGESGMAATRPHATVDVSSRASTQTHIGTDWFGRFADAYRVEIDEWVADLRGGPFRGPTVWDGYAAQVVAAAGVEAYRSGQRVAVDLPARPTLYDA